MSISWRSPAPALRPGQTHPHLPEWFGNGGAYAPLCPPPHSTATAWELGSCTNWKHNFTWIRITPSKQVTHAHNQVLRKSYSHTNFRPPKRTINCPYIFINLSTSGKIPDCVKGVKYLHPVPICCPILVIHKSRVRWIQVWLMQK